MDVPESGLGEVADVHHDAETLHLGDSLHSETGKSTACIPLTDSIRHHRAAIPCHSDHSHADAKVGREDIQIPANSFSTLECEHAGNPS